MLTTLLTEAPTLSLDTSWISTVIQGVKSFLPIVTEFPLNIVITIGLVGMGIKIAKSLTRFVR